MTQDPAPQPLPDPGPGTWMTDDELALMARLLGVPLYVVHVAAEDLPE